jgi:hypothetical protein
VVTLIVAVGSIFRAPKGRVVPIHGRLIDAADPVALLSRSLTQPVMIMHGQEGHEHVEGDEEALASAVVPGQPGPADPSEAVD